MAKKNTKTSKASKTEKLNAVVIPEVLPEGLTEGTVDQTIVDEVNREMGKPTESSEPVEAPTSEKILKKSLSDDVLAERLAQARTRKGEIVRFLCTKTEVWTIGLIRTARLDKRSGFIQFRIEILDYPLEDENPAEFSDPTGLWISEDEEVPVRRTNILYGKGDDSKDLQVVGTYKALAKAPKVKDEEPSAEAFKKSKKTSKKSKKEAPKAPSAEDEAMAAAIADMQAEGLM